MNDYIFDKYMQDINIYPLLTAERERELGKIIQHSSDEKDRLKAKNELVQSNLRLVVKCAIGYRRMSGTSETDISLMDLIQTGNIGLMRACDLFNPDRHARFSSYAWIAIERRIRAFIDQSGFVRLPTAFSGHFRKITKLKNIHGINLTDKMILENINVDERILGSIKGNMNARVTTEDIDLLLEKFIDNENLNAYQIFVNQESREYIYKKMKELKPFYRDILFYKFFGNEHASLVKISKRFGCTREAIRMALARAIRHLIMKVNEEKAMINVGIK